MYQGPPPRGAVRAAPGVGDRVQGGSQKTLKEQEVAALPTSGHWRAELPPLYPLSDGLVQGNTSINDFYNFEID